MLLSEARARVLAMVFDDANNTWTDAEINQKLKVAHEYVVTRYAAEGGDLLDEAVTVTTVDGYGNLGTIKPLAIRAVFKASSATAAGATFYELPAVPTTAPVQLSREASTLRVVLVRKPTTPTADASAFGYGAGVSSELLDELVCLQAARLLAVKTGDVDPALETQFNELLSTLISDETVITAYDMAEPSPYINRTGFQYFSYGIQLVSGWC